VLNKVIFLPYSTPLNSKVPKVSFFDLSLLALPFLLAIKRPMLHKRFFPSWLVGGVRVGFLMMFALGGPHFTSASADEIRFADFESVAEKYNLDPFGLYAVSLVESSRKVGNLVYPYPWALNYKGQSYFYASREEAEKSLRKFLSAPGRAKPDIGMMQINLRWHPQAAASPYHLLDPITSLQAGGKILAAALHSTNDLALGYGRYHTWSDNDAARRYGQKVIQIANKIKEWRMK